MEGFNHRHIAIKLLIVGVVFVLVRLYTDWDIWVVIGAILVIKAILLFVMPAHNCDSKESKIKKK